MEGRNGGTLWNDNFRWTSVGSEDGQGKGQESLNYSIPFWGNQTIEMYGNFQ